jgi:hypothetical protein
MPTLTRVAGAKQQIAHARAPGPERFIDSATWRTPQIAPVRLATPVAPRPEAVHRPRSIQQRPSQVKGPGLAVTTGEVVLDE